MKNIKFLFLIILLSFAICISAKADFYVNTTNIYCTDSGYQFGQGCTGAYNSSVTGFAYWWSDDLPNGSIRYFARNATFIGIKNITNFHNSVDGFYYLDAYYCLGTKCTFFANLTGTGNHIRTFPQCSGGSVENASWGIDRFAVDTSNVIYDSLYFNVFGRPAEGGCSASFAVLNDLNVIVGQSGNLSNNQLPVFNYNYSNNICINSTTKTNNFFFNFSCIDPEGNTCYYSSIQTKTNQVYMAYSFDEGAVSVNLINDVSSPGVLNGIINFFTYELSQLFPDGVIFGFSDPSYRIVTDGTLQTECSAFNGYIIDSVSAFPLNNYMLIDNGCTTPINLTIPNDAGSVFDRFYSLEFAPINNTLVPNQIFNDYSESMIRFKDSMGNNMLNFTFTRNFTTQNLTLYINGAKIFSNVTNANVFRLFLSTNSTDNTYRYYVFSQGATRNSLANVLYNSSSQAIFWNNLRYIQLWTFYGNPVAYDDIIYGGFKVSNDWSTTFPLTINATLADQFLTYRLFVSDSVNYVNGIYNTYDIPISVSSKYCGEGLYTSADTPEKRGGIKGIIFLLTNIYNMANSMGAQAYFNAVGWLFYMLFFLFVLFKTWAFDKALIYPSIAVFILGVTGLLQIAFLISSIILLSLGLTMRIWLNAGVNE